MKIVNVTSTRGVVERGRSAQFDGVRIGVLRAGDTAVIEYELAVLGDLTSAQRLSLGKLAALPSIPIKTELGDGVVMAPMKMEAMRDRKTLEDIDGIVEELGLLSNNLRDLTDKTASELGRSLADYYDYTVSLQRAVSIGDCYEALGKLMNLMSGLKDLREMPGKLRESAQSIQKNAGNLKRRLDALVKSAEDGKALSYLQRQFDASLRLLRMKLKDPAWVITNTPKDVKYWESAFSEIDGALQASFLNGAMSETFQNYVALTKESASVLADATAAIDAAMKTADAAERRGQTKLARAKMEQAARLLRQAELLKGEGNGLFDTAVSGIEGKENKYLDVMADSLRVQAKRYAADAETLLEQQITGVAASLNQLAALEQVEGDVAVLQESAGRIEALLGGDELVADDTAALRNAADSIFETIGYDPDAPAEERLNALRTGRRELEKSMWALAQRPVVWLTDMWNIVDSAQLREIRENLPDSVRAVGAVLSALETNEITESRLPGEILDVLYNNVPAAYDWFWDEFDAGFPNTNDRNAIRRYVATEMVKIMPRRLANVELMEKSLQTQMLDGMSDYRAMIEAAQASALGRQTTVYHMQDDMDAQLERTIALLERYKSDPRLLTGYYPSSQLLDYVRNLNAAISAMTHYANGKPIEDSRVGRYRSLWTYSGEGYDLNVNELTLGEIYKTQQVVDQLLAEGYNNVAERYLLNMMKELENGVSVLATGLGMLGLSDPAGSLLSAMAGAASVMLDTSQYTTAMNTLDNANLYNLAQATADLAITTNLMLAKEAGIAYDLYSVFDTMESWRKVDPALPIEIVTADVADLVTGANVIADAAEAALTVHNAHTGSVTVSPTVEVYDSFGLVNTVSMGTETIAPGASGEFVASVRVPINLMRDMGGYTAVFTFAASEAETMTIAPTYGPYVTHFNAGTADTVRYLRDNAEASQPLGGTLAAGERESAALTVSGGKTLRVFAAAASGDALTLTVDGAGTRETKTILNADDFVFIPDASGSYTVTVANDGDTALTYDLSAVIAPDFGAVLGLDMPYGRAVAGAFRVTDRQSGETVTGVKASLPLSVYETGLTAGMSVTVEASALADGAGNRIDAPELTNRRGETVDGTADLAPGGSLSLVLGYYPEPDAPAGEYSGTVTLRVAAERFNTELSALDWVESGDGYAVTIPVMVLLPDPADAPSVEIEAAADGGAVTVVGTTKPGAAVAVFLAEDEDGAGEAVCMTTADADGAIDTVFTPKNSGTFYVYARGVGGQGQLGAESGRVPVRVRTGDRTAPEIVLLTPQTDVQLGSAVTELIFTVSDAQSAVEDVPTLSVDGVYAEVTEIAAGRYRAIPATAVGDGTHTVRIRATSGGGTARETFTVIVGGSVEACLTVTADGKPLALAAVTLNGETRLTDGSGRAAFELAPGEYAYTVAADGCLTASGTASISAASRDVPVALLAGGNLTVRVTGGALAVPGASVTLGEYQTVTDADGGATLTVPYGSYSWRVTADGYRSGSGSVRFTADGADELTVSLTADRSHRAAVRLRVTDAAGKAIAGVAVTLDGEALTTDENGELLCWKSVGTYDCVIAAEPYAPYTGSLTVDAAGGEESVRLNAAGVAYDERSETLHLAGDRTAWTEETGGEPIADGGAVARTVADRLIYMESPSGERVPFVIPALDDLRVRGAEADGETVSVRIANGSGAARTVTLLAALYDGDGRYVAAATAEASIAYAAEQSIALRLGTSAVGCAVRVFVLDAATRKPLCPAWELR